MRLGVDRHVRMRFVGPGARWWKGWKNESSDWRQMVGTCRVPKVRKSCALSIAGRIVPILELRLSYPRNARSTTTPFLRDANGLHQVIYTYIHGLH